MPTCGYISMCSMPRKGPLKAVPMGGCDWVQPTVPSPCLFKFLAVQPGRYSKRFYWTKTVCSLFLATGSANVLSLLNSNTNLVLQIHKTVILKTLVFVRLPGCHESLHLIPKMTMKKALSLSFYGWGGGPSLGEEWTCSIWKKSLEEPILNLCQRQRVVKPFSYLPPSL